MVSAARIPWPMAGKQNWEGRFLAEQRPPLAASAEN
jgi:hypothetical protein